ncbi:hypothetical protein [Permianibacter aggregans]|uniref:hypothetical protein n=1 Tax=Permianibacter aggregans TaxID=1510150 RepID=UPI00106155E6|nr:hypothetical protein [Permianibacter aggregans]QGX38187.1 hypothetical protein E2H98_00270 [Permianibacter aggregans]
MSQIPSQTITKKHWRCWLVLLVFVLQSVAVATTKPSHVQHFASGGAEIHQQSQECHHQRGEPQISSSAECCQHCPGAALCSPFSGSGGCDPLPHAVSLVSNVVICPLIALVANERPHTRAFSARLSDHDVYRPPKSTPSIA